MFKLFSRFNLSLLPYLILVLSVFSFVNCGYLLEFPVVPVTGVSITGEDCCSEGETIQLTADILPFFASDKTVIWTSHDTAVARIDSSGLVSGLSTGTAVITVTTIDGGYQDSREITVNEPVIIDVTGLSLSGESSCAVGEAIQLTATVIPHDATDPSVIWSSTDTNIAAIDSGGLVTGVAIGTTYITATTRDGGFQDSMEITILEPVVYVTGVDLLGSSSCLRGDTIQLFAVVLPAEATDSTLSWESSNEAVATVSGNGLVSGITAGSALVTVTTYDGGFQDSLTITVYDLNIEVTGVTLSGSTDCTVGESLQMTATVHPANASDPGVTWESDNTDVITVNDSGLVTGISAGTASVTVTTNDGRYQDSLTITVHDFHIDVTGVSLAGVNSCTEGESIQLIAVISPSNATEPSVTWESSDTSVATVNSTGLVTSLSSGTTAITVTTTSGGFQDSLLITVSEAVIRVSGVSLSGESNCIEGETIQMTAEVLPANATDTAVTWESSDTAVATVDQSGLVYAISDGSTTLTVTTADGGFQDSLLFTVDEPVIYVTGVTLTGDNSCIEGESIQMSAEVLPANATDTTVAWDSGDTDVATVNGSGLVSALSEGTTTITVTTGDGGFQDSAVITVNTAIVNVTGVTLTGDNSCTEGGTVQMTAEVLPANATDTTVAWDSGDTDVATVNGSGLVSALSEGTTTITVTTGDGGFQDSLQFSVIETSQTSTFADHLVMNDLYDNTIPQSALENAVKDLHIFYGHTSHGGQILAGMTELVSFANNSIEFDYDDNLFAWDNDDLEDTLHLENTSADLGGDWVTITTNYLNDPSNGTCNVVMWSWCGQLSYYSESAVQYTYLEKMEELENDFPGITFIYMTGHVDGTGQTGNLHLRNEQIREFCRERGKWLYDFADIEQYDLSGAYFGNRLVNDECYYDSDGNGTLDANWAQEWQDSHVEGTEWFDCNPAHTQPVNANQKAYAAWWLFSRIAGWEE